VSIGLLEVFVFWFLVASFTGRIRRVISFQKTICAVPVPVLKMRNLRNL
jgi:hypothetical protein